MAVSGYVLVATAQKEDAAHVASTIGERGHYEIGHAGDGRIALNEVRSRTVDVLIADAVLPGLDGPALFESVFASTLRVYPSMIMMRSGRMRLRKADEGYPVLEKPLRGAALQEALERTRPERRSVPEKKRARVEELLAAVGIREHCGREYLLRSILIAWQDGRYLHHLTTRLYPAVAELYGVDARHVARAMGHVIDEAWRSGEIDAQYDLFGDTIDAHRGSPTCGEMIARIAEILRWEGKS